MTSQSVKSTEDFFINKNPYYHSLEFWEKQVDGQVHMNYKNIEWVKNQIGNMEETEDTISKWIWNATSIGNIAFLACNAPTIELKTKCTNIFNMILPIFQSNNYTEVDDYKKQIGCIGVEY